MRSSAASASDEAARGATALRRRMAADLANGARPGWLLLPEQRAPEIWLANARSEGPSERLEPAEALESGDAFP